MNQIISNKINNTRSFFKELTQATLESLGWTVNEEKGYLLATNLNNQSYLIHCTGQKKSSKSEMESTTSRVNENTIKKLKQQTNLISDYCIPCISYGLAKHTMDDIEITIVPTYAIEELGVTGGVYSNASNDYHYNYAKVEDGELPEKAIFRKQWRAV